MSIGALGQGLLRSTHRLRVELARCGQLDHLGRVALKVDTLAYVEISQVQFPLFLSHELFVRRRKDILVKRGVVHGPFKRVLLKYRVLRLLVSNAL